MKNCLWLIVSFALVASAHAFPTRVVDDQSIPPSLLGKWTWTRAQNNCTETYDFRADGNLLVVSGEETSDNIFEMATEADQAGFYRLTITTLRDHGGRDCGDSAADDTGQTIDLYTLFDPSKTTYIVCQQPNLSACFGPLKRLP